MIDSRRTGGILSPMLALEDRKNFIPELSVVLPRASELSIKQGKNDIGTQEWFHAALLENSELRLLLQDRWGIQETTMQNFCDTIPGLVPPGMANREEQGQDWFEELSLTPRLQEAFQIVQQEQSSPVTPIDVIVAILRDPHCISSEFFQSLVALHVVSEPWSGSFHAKEEVRRGLIDLARLLDQS